MATLAPGPAARTTANIKVIDVDAHLSEPEDLWTKRAPAKFRDRVPQVAMVDGQAAWVIDGKHVLGRGASSTYHKDGRTAEGLEYVGWRNEDVVASSYDVKERIRQLDATGIHAQIVYPNVIGFGGQKTAAVDPELRLASIQIFNDAMAEVYEESGRRLYPMAALPWWDVKEAVAETRRAHGNGIRGININSDPHLHTDPEGKGLPDLSDEYWNPLWELCEGLDIPINFHIGASDQSMAWVDKAAWPSLPEQMMAAMVGSMLFIDNGRVLGNIIYSGLLDRFPKLKFVSVESGLGWVPFILESIDYQFESLITQSNLLYKPSEYFQRNFYACFWFEKRDLSHMIEQVGVDNCMFETDFPHPVSLHPSPLDYIEDALTTLDESARHKVMSGNAARVYNIPV